MEITQCELCVETITPSNEHTCSECGKRTCEECGRTRPKQAQSGRSLNAVVDSWQCNACEFGSPS